MELSGRKKRTVNVAPWERGISAVTGLLLLALAVTKRKPLVLGLTLPLGAYMVFRAATGYCLTYEALGIRTNAGPGTSQNGKGVHIKRAVTVMRPLDEVYRYWRQLENLPLFMKHIKSVRQLDERRSHWVAKAPVGVEWDAEITGERPLEYLAWSSVPGSQVQTSGQVTFKHAPADRGTIVDVTLEYRPAGGPFGSMAAKLLKVVTESEIAMDLGRFKAMLEAGEVATTEGQPSGRQREHKAVDKARVRHDELTQRKDQVVEASEQSFPASDPPGWISSSA